MADKYTQEVPVVFLMHSPLLILQLFGITVYFRLYNFQISSAVSKQCIVLPLDTPTTSIKIAEGVANCA